MHKHSTGPETEITDALDADAAKVSGMEQDAGPTIDKTIEIDDGSEWAIIEIFGHRQHAGKIREVEKFGAKMVRVDVPIFSTTTPVPDRWETRLYGGGSIFSVSYTDEETVMRGNRPYPNPYRISARDTDADDEDCPI